jgi:hypothetical protein
MSPIKLGSILFHHVLVVLLGRRNFTPFLDLLYMSLNKITNFLKKKEKEKKSATNSNAPAVCFDYAQRD